LRSSSILRILLKSCQPFSSGRSALLWLALSLTQDKARAG